MLAPSRPVLRWHGGKWRLAPWIIEHFPAHRLYVEPFGGAASVLLRKPRCYAEIYNDLNGEVVTLFRVLRDPAMAAQLIELLRLTPFARQELPAAYEPSPDPVEQAPRLVVRSYLGFGSAGVNGATTGFRSNSNRSGTVPPHAWVNYPECLGATVQRLRGVCIEQKDATAVMVANDGPDTLFYVDPPYLPETRSKKKGPQGMYHSYVHDMTEDDHGKLLTGLKRLAGMVVLSGYPSPMYEAALCGWERVECEALADGALPRKEVLWLNPAAAGVRPVQHGMAWPSQSERNPRCETFSVCLVGIGGGRQGITPLP